MRHVTQFVAACGVCQRSKYEIKFLAGLLQPLPISTRVWEDISLDFIIGLPRACGVDCVLVVVDRLTKTSHYLVLKHPLQQK